MYNAMAGVEKVTKLVVVYTKETQQYASYLIQLIGTKDDEGDRVVGLKDNSVIAASWSEKEYENNRPQIGSSDYILFIGDSSLIRKEEANMNQVFNQYGMTFSSLGTRAAMSVSKKILKKKEYEAFLDFCSEYKKEFEKKVKLNALNSASPTLKWIGTLFLPIAIAPVFLYGLYSGREARKKLNDQQYSFLTLYSYLELLPKFLEA